MARTVQEIYDKAIHLIDAQNESTGSTSTADTKEYQVRACELLNTLLNEAYPYSDTYAEETEEYRPGKNYGPGDKVSFGGWKYLFVGKPLEKDDPEGTEAPGEGTDWKLVGRSQKGRRPTLEPVNTLEDLVDMDDFICLSALPAGLAALFTYDEDQTKYNAFWGDYMNRLRQAKATLPAAGDGFEDIENPYAGGWSRFHGGIEHGEYGAWPW